MRQYEKSQSPSRKSDSELASNVQLIQASTQSPVPSEWKCDISDSQLMTYAEVVRTPPKNKTPPTKLSSSRITPPKNKTPPTKLSSSRVTPPKNKTPPTKLSSSRVTPPRIRHHLLNSLLPGGIILPNQHGLLIKILLQLTQLNLYGSVI